MTTGENRPQHFPKEPGPHGPGAGPGSPGAPHRRSHSFVPLAVAVWVIAEIWLFLLLADLAGGLGVLAVVAAGFLLGALAIKRAGRRAWRNLTESLQAGGPPPGTSPSGGNGLAMLGGLLLMLPGLLSDLFGLLCLFPPTAGLLRRGVVRWAERGGLAPGGLGDAVRQARTAGEQVRIHRPDGKVVPGEVIREDPPREGGLS
ncbi:FxsA family membrane protein [Streptomyces sp. 549]|uniref:FxsA family membrane protein n=1 Tax=Streptomyces sp. 549 TaxID=3049076 RepID=UPI0024C2812C|nr:FxsA family membrane protein [Streptomyces sp. 549]MDK1473309.1 FxsA family membrane protein [Streptomyces sp. 549]